MRHILDKELGGHAMLFDGLLELVDAATEGNQGKDKPLVRLNRFSENWTGRELSTWKAVRDACTVAWDEGVQRVKAMLDEIQQMQLPTPKSRRRIRRWGDDGDVSVDKLLRDDQKPFSYRKRQVTRGPAQIALLCNLDAYAGDTPAKIFWRGAAAIAAADLLEQNGYSTEIWMWCRGYAVFRSPHDAQFTCAPLKQCDDPIDIGNICSGLSAWYLRTAVFGSFAKWNARSIGGVNYDLGPWRKYMDITSGLQEIHMPVAQSKEEAIAGAIKILNEVIATHE